MSKQISKRSIFLLKALKNPAILYIISRYGTYLVKFINSVFIAAYLGPYYLGIWGFINLVLGYIGQFNLGISNSVNVIISVNKKDDEYIKKIIGNGISMTILLSIFLSFFFLLNQFGRFEIGLKYDFSIYSSIVLIIGILTHFNNLFIYVLRVYGKLYAIAINQSLFPLFTILLIPFFRNQELLWALFIANLVSTIISFLMLFIQIPIKLNPTFNWNIIKIIQKKGWFLFLFNASFHLIMITTNSFISGCYSIEEFGYFTFSYTLANVILLLLNAIGYIINPKVLNRFANYSNENIIPILKDIRTAYVSLSHFLIHFSIMIFPLFILFFKKYDQSYTAFQVVALTVALYSNSYGYQALIIAKNKEKNIGIISLIALLLNITISVIFVYWIKVQFSYVMFATAITYFIYTLISGLIGRRELSLSSTVKDTLKDVFPIRMIVPFATSIILVLGSFHDIYFVVPFVLYIFLNYRDLINIKRMIMRVIKSPNSINI